MALKVKAVERKIKFSKNDEGVWRYVMQPELYIALTQAKVIKEAALRSGCSQGVMKACWDAAGEVIKAWATEGHSVALPGLGTMRFGLRAKSVEKVEISITPAEGQVPTATLNGSSIELTESDGVYTGNFAMPGQASTLVINTGAADDDGFDKD